MLKKCVLRTNENENERELMSKVLLLNYSSLVMEHVQGRSVTSNFCHPCIRPWEYCSRFLSAKGPLTVWSSSHCGALRWWLRLCTWQLVRRIYGSEWVPLWRRDDWLPVWLKPGFHSNASACVSCGFRLRNACNASDCVWMETGLDVCLSVYALVWTVTIVAALDGWLCETRADSPKSSPAGLRNTHDSCKPGACCPIGERGWPVTVRPRYIYSAFWMCI